jgi:two-component system phosphate regulon response regulator PhoB
MHIHIIEDNADLADLLRQVLEAESIRVTASAHGVDGLAAIRRTRPDLLLLDLMLPGLDGFEICRQLRADKLTARLPIIIISVKNRESDIVLGLGLGADDYILKPFGIGEVVARIRSVLRRCQAPLQPELDPIEVHGIRIDPAKCAVTVEGRELQFTATEFKLLAALGASPGRVFTREILKSMIMGYEVLNHNIDVHINKIRHKLGEREDLIETVRGMGYRFRDNPLPVRRGPG